MALRRILLIGRYPTNAAADEQQAYAASVIEDVV
jgi:hypothetical protein